MRKQLIILSLILLLLPTISLAENVEIGTYILSIREYNLEEGTFIADFYLWFRFNNTNPEGFEIMNGNILEKKKTYEEPGYIVYRVEAKLHTTPDFKNYPIDTQKIEIIIEDQSKQINELKYIIDKKESGLDEDFKMAGWKFTKVSQEVLEKNYKSWDEKYSRYIHSVEFSRPKTALLKALIPFLFILISAWACFFIDIKKLGERLALAATALLSSVVFHIFLTEQIPRVGYLILADKIVLTMYAFLVYTIVGFIIIDGKRFHQERWNIFFRNSSIIFAALFFIILLFF